MKLLLVFLSLAAVALAALSHDQKMERINNECRKKSGLTVEEVGQMIELPDELPKDNSKVKKHLLCVYVKTGLISESGDINPDVIKEMLERGGFKDETVAKVVNCLIKKDTPEDTAFEFAKCAVKKQWENSSAH